jgi:hypothetical protein
MQFYKVHCNWPVQKEVTRLMRTKDPVFPKQAPIWLEMFDLV